MADLVFKDIEKRFGSIVAVRDVNLCLSHGQFVCFLGPSGCGKTTLLRLVAGLDMPTKGCIFLNDMDITHTPAHKRNFGMVFQSLALFPHLSVGENVAYSLKIRKVDKEARNKRTQELLELVQLSGASGRYISQLSGGQRQRVAIARALAFEPGLFLLDEPLSALDAKLREDMQMELRMLQKRLGITTIVVTHDQREAMTMSDLVVVMGPDNRVHQVGPPLEIYRNPSDKFVADFIGTTNLLTGFCRTLKEIEVGETVLQVEGVSSDIKPGTKVTVSVRPENILVVPGVEKGENRLQGKISFIRDVGSNVEIYMDCNGIQIISQSTPKGRPQVNQGDTATAILPSEVCGVLSS